MSFGRNLERVVRVGAYPQGRVTVRWGQLIRSSPSVSESLLRGVNCGRIVELDTLGVLYGGVVTRANAYFLVREVPFEKIPKRMRVTPADLQHIAVVTDGLHHVSKIERQFLMPAIKSPASLASATHTQETDLRLVDVNCSKEMLKKEHLHGALAYLKRGETVDYKLSDDNLKGGIPARRSQVKIRRPYWYSLQGRRSTDVRIVFPEHINSRYVFTLVPAGLKDVVIDKLYTFEPHVGGDVELIHASLNSLLSWYQVELRGRSQLGEGVLELKKPDFAGVAVLNPIHISELERAHLLDAFRELRNVGANASFDELGSPARHAFDIAYLKACGFDSANASLERLEQTLRALAGERTERRLSVVDAKVRRRRMTNVAAVIDAYAARVVASMELYPDPRKFVEPRAVSRVVPIGGVVDGPLRVGAELFDQGEVFAGDTCVAKANDMREALFIKGVLQTQPDLTHVEVPTSQVLVAAMEEWAVERRRWHERFEQLSKEILKGLDDRRTKRMVEERALRLLHGT